MDILVLIGWLFLASIPCMVVLFFYARGRRLTEVPACPKCRHCVRESPDSHCPECGNDLSASGVLDKLYIQPDRSSKAGIVLLLLFVGLIPAGIIANRSAHLFTNLHIGVEERLSGIQNIEVNILPNANYAGPVRTIIVTWPGWFPPSTVDTSYNDPEWVHPGIFPTRVSMTTEDGKMHDILISNERGRLELNESPSTPDAEQMGSLISSGDPGSLQKQLDSWMMDQNLAGIQDQTFRDLCDYLVQIMLDADSFLKHGAASTGFVLPWRWKEDPVPYRDYQQKLRIVGLTSGGTDGYSQTNAINPIFILLLAWILVWTIVSLVTLMAASRTRRSAGPYEGSLEH